MLKVRFMSTESFREYIGFVPDYEKSIRDIVSDFLINTWKYENLNDVKIVDQVVLGNYVIYDQDDVILIMKMEEFDDELDDCELDFE